MISFYLPAHHHELEINMVKDENSDDKLTELKSQNQLHGATDSTTPMDQQGSTAIDKTTSAKSTPPSSAATVENGFLRTNFHLRSILSHPISFILTFLLNALTFPVLKSGFDIATNILETTLRPYISTEDDAPYQTIFSNAANTWTSGNETDLTKAILIEMATQGGFRTITNTTNESITSTSSVSTEDLLFVGEKTISENGRPDFIISKKEIKKESIVMTIEVGINNALWWQKHDQLLKYVEMLLRKRKDELSKEASTQEASSKEVSTQAASTQEASSKEVSTQEASSHPKNPKLKKTFQIPYTFEDPILLTIITVDSKTKKARFGMFLCTPKNAYTDYRIALLWRIQTSTFEAASKQFGKVLYAAKMCAYLRQHEVARSFYEYEYLGPNCCKFGEYVSILTCAFFRFGLQLSLARPDSNMTLMIQFLLLHKINHVLCVFTVEGLPILR